MSAIRRIDRRAARKIQSSPYARQTLPKKSWSISGLLSYFNPLRSKSPVVDEDEPEDLSPVSDDDASIAETISAKGRQDLNVHGRLNVTVESSVSTIGPSFPVPTAPTTPTQSDTNFSLNDPSPSSAKNLETVAAFLTQKGGQPLNEVEAEGLVSLIQKSTQNDEKHEPFRFSSSTPSTPGRENSPNFDFTSPNSPNGANSQSPRKTLSKNPNGIYRWEGGGSARPRNRFRSPAFGPPRSTAASIKLSPPEAPRTDTKRRRLGEEADTPSSQQVPVASTSGVRSSAPSPSRPIEPSFPFPVSNSNPSPIRTPPPLKVNGVSTPRSRLSTLPPKPTVPAVPSPLRQAWGQTDSSSPSHSALSSKPTKAANFMQELIKGVTPPKRPDVSNPYQTASPVKPPARKPIKRTRATGKPSVPPPQKEPEPSPQAIIEATVPKGSKRSRPPANLEKTLSGDSSISPPRSPQGQTPELPAINGINGTSHVQPETSPKSYPAAVVEEVSDEEDIRATKKQKIANGISSQSITVEEVEDDDMHSSCTPTRPSEVIEPLDSHSTKPNGFIPSNSSGAPSATGRPPFSGKSSAPKEPSKLRFSYQPDASSSSATPTPSPQPSQFVQTMGELVKLEPKDAARAMDVDALPKFSFVFRESSNFARPSDIASKAAQTAPVSSLPTFDFSMTPKSNSRSIGASTAVKVPSATPVAFNWGAAGMATPAKSGGASWTCSTCMLTNPATATDKCTVCDAPHP